MKKLQPPLLHVRSYRSSRVEEIKLLVFGNDQFESQRGSKMKELLLVFQNVWILMKVSKRDSYSYEWFAASWKPFIESLAKSIELVVSEKRNKFKKMK